MSSWRNSLKLRRLAGLWEATRERRPSGPAKGLRLQALPTSVPADLDLLTPTMRVVVIEDLCWALTRDAWLARRPHWWRLAARQAWAAGRTELAAKQQRLRELAEAAGHDTVTRD